MISLGDRTCRNLRSRHSRDITRDFLCEGASKKNHEAKTSWASPSVRLAGELTSRASMAGRTKRHALHSVGPCLQGQMESDNQFCLQVLSKLDQEGKGFVVN